MQEVIVVCGLSNSGKTESIIKARDLLLNFPKTTTIFLPKRKTKRDFVIVIKIDGIIIAIISAGDRVELINSALKKIAHIK